MTLLPPASWEASAAETAHTNQLLHIIQILAKEPPPQPWSSSKPIRTQATTRPPLPADQTERFATASATHIRKVATAGVAHALMARGGSKIPFYPRDRRALRRVYNRQKRRERETSCGRNRGVDSSVDRSPVGSEMCACDAWNRAQVRTKGKLFRRFRTCSTLMIAEMTCVSTRSTWLAKMLPRK